MFYFDYRTGQFRRVKTGRYVKTVLALKDRRKIKGKFPRFIKEYRTKLAIELSKNRDKDIKRVFPEKKKEKFNLNSKQGLLSDYLKSFITSYTLEGIEDAY